MRKDCDHYYDYDKNKGLCINCGGSYAEHTKNMDLKRKLNKSFTNANDAINRDVSTEEFLDYHNFPYLFYRLPNRSFLFCLLCFS